MTYQVLARKYRPQTFAGVLGQEHITRTLQNAIQAGRLHHAYLFTGVRGVGKTTVARILAKALNCEKAPSIEPCNNCKSCADITAGSNMDVLEIDGASNTGVDDVREIRDRLKYLPAQGRYKIYIIDEVHMLSNAAFNALLKTLEEPPSHVVFVFATTEPHKIPATILSRCQRHDFRRISVKTIADAVRAIAVSEGIEIEPDALIAIAGEAEGSMRDAQSLFDQAVAFTGGNVTFAALKEMLGFMDRAQLKALLEALAGKDARRALGVVDEIFDQGGNLVRLAQELLFWIRGMLIFRATGDQAFLKDVPGEDREFVGSLSQRLELSEWEQMFKICYRQVEEISRTKYPKMLMEALSVQLSGLGPVRSVDSLLEKVDGLIAGVKPAAMPQAFVAPPLSLRPRAERGGSNPDSALNSLDRHVGLRPPRDDGATSTTSSDSKVPEEKTDASIPNPAASPTIADEEWRKFMAWLDVEKPQLSSILQRGVFIGGGKGSVRLQYSGESIYGEMLKEDHRRKQLEDFIERHFGEKYRVELNTAGEGMSAGEKRTAELKEKKERTKKIREETMEHELVKEAANILGADIREIRVKE